MSDSIFKPAQRVRAYEAIVQQIEGAIYTGRLVPGQRLASERELMRQFGVSRATVREALRVLESSGLIKLRHGDPGGGAKVQPFSTDILRKPITSLIHLENVDLSGTVEFRMVLEGASTHLAALARSEQQLDLMKRRNEEVRRQIGSDLDGFIAADAEFHKAVAQSCGNLLLSSCGEVIHAIVVDLVAEKLLRAADTTALMQEIVERHGRILQAIAARDPLQAAARAKRDILDFYGPWLEDAGRLRLASFMDQHARTVRTPPQERAAR